MQAVRYVIRYLHASTHTHTPQSQHTRGLKSRFPLKGCGINCLYCLLNFSNEGAMKRFSNCYICVKQTWNWSVLSTMSVVTKVKCQDHCSESRLQGLNTTNWGTMAASWKHEWIASLKKIMAHQQKYCILLHKEKKTVKTLYGERFQTVWCNMTHFSAILSAHPEQYRALLLCTARY